MYQIIVFSLSALLTASILLAFRRVEDERFDKFLKWLTLAFCAVGFFRFVLSDSFIYVINGGWFNGEYYKTTDVLQSILRWGYYSSYSVLPVAAICKGRFFRSVSSYYCLPFAILTTVFFNEHMEYFLSDMGHGVHTSSTFRYVYFVLELVIAITIPLLIQLRYKHVINLRDKKEVINFFTGLLFLIPATMPVYVAQSFVGYRVNTPPMFGNFHITWIVLLFVVTVALYYAFRFKSYKERYQLCLFLTILLFFHYDSLYLMGMTIKRLPFQLCNIASYFYIIALAFDLKKMFQFCFLANMVGTLIAILMPDFSVGSFGFWNMHYIFEHSLVLIIPAMVMGLRIHPRIDRKSLKYFFIGFTAYFMFAFIMGTVLNGYSDITGEKVNYFFMFDLDMAFDYFPFLKFIERYPVSFGRFEFYPFIVLIIYVAFSLLSCLFYLVVKFAYKLEDDHLELRRSGIELYERITKKTSKRPRYFID